MEIYYSSRLTKLRQDVKMYIFAKALLQIYFKTSIQVQRFKRFHCQPGGFYEIARLIFFHLVTYYMCTSKSDISTWTGPNPNPVFNLIWLVLLNQHTGGSAVAEDSRLCEYCLCSLWQV